MKPGDFSAFTKLASEYRESTDPKRHPVAYNARRSALLLGIPAAALGAVHVGGLSSGGLGPRLAGGAVGATLGAVLGGAGGAIGGAIRGGAESVYNKTKPSTDALKNPILHRVVPGAMLGLVVGGPIAGAVGGAAYGAVDKLVRSEKAVHANPPKGKKS